MSQKMHVFITQQLPNVLENVKKTHEQKMVKTEEQEKTQANFIQSFLNTNHYFYVASTDKYFMYDGLHYSVCKEDDIWYKIALSMSQTKQRTKTQIIRKIKEKSLFKTIPESETIQNVLSKLVPGIFPKKSLAKYFLTIVGDNILKKSTDLTHFIDPKAKPFLQELNHFAQAFLGQNIHHSIRYRFTGNEYNKCRLIQISDTVHYENIWVPIVRDDWLDLFCVATHYSIRYESSDQYAESDTEISEYTFALKHTTPENHIESFVIEFIQTSVMETTSTTITWKNMQFLWRKFLDSRGLPNIMYSHNFKTMICERLSGHYNAASDTFNGIHSKYMPDIQSFLQFWNETIVFDETEMDFEIEELKTLYKIWMKTKTHKTIFNEKQILELMAFYFPEVEIESEKYICKIRSSMWDKSMDIQVILEMMKTTAEIAEPFPIYEAYLYYCKQKEQMRNKMIVSKSYFEKWILENMSESVIDDKFIAKEWFAI
jgi:hypothetical protein